MTRLLNLQLLDDALDGARLVSMPQRTHRLVFFPAGSAKRWQGDPRFETAGVFVAFNRLSEKSPSRIARVAAAGTPKPGSDTGALSTALSNLKINSEDLVLISNSSHGFSSNELFALATLLVDKLKATGKYDQVLFPYSGIDHDIEFEKLSMNEVAEDAALMLGAMGLKFLQPYPKGPQRQHYPDSLPTSFGVNARFQPAAPQPPKPKAEKAQEYQPKRPDSGRIDLERIDSQQPQANRQPVERPEVPRTVPASSAPEIPAPPKPQSNPIPERGLGQLPATTAPKPVEPVRTKPDSFIPETGYVPPQAPRTLARPGIGSALKKASAEAARSAKFLEEADREQSPTPTFLRDEPRPATPPAASTTYSQPKLVEADPNIKLHFEMSELDVSAKVDLTEAGWIIRAGSQLSYKEPTTRNSKRLRGKFSDKITDHFYVTEEITLPGQLTPHTVAAFVAGSTSEGLNGLVSQVGKTLRAYFVDGYFYQNQTQPAPKTVQHRNEVYTRIGQQLEGSPYSNLLLLELPSASRYAAPLTFTMKLGDGITASLRYYEDCWVLERGSVLSPDISTSAPGFVKDLRTRLGLADVNSRILTTDLIFSPRIHDIAIAGFVAGRSRTNQDDWHDARNVSYQTHIAAGRIKPYKEKD
ncbi:hypothetical protein BSR28_01065 [Boudabousia liubingyangii]|uniref:hypothetical protein n=1 Tax=Boudabousia liubingyangii TaxID=1921764 RepID=UPI000960924F|nr:hypothetical protein [Boudabousia liubingyangii]OKL48326.1 hypothetical protein BSR28_01065 [Boudabousia liubingyangii]